MIYTIGEMLIDFVAHEKGRPLKDVSGFTKIAGGAPANVAAATARLGGRSALISQVGKDAFGDFLLETLKDAGVAVHMIRQTSKAKTGLAFVSVMENGERDFSFYRNPSADLLLEPHQVDTAAFSSTDILHFCSVGLVESPMQSTHRHVITQMKERGGLISFDPNVRLSLWENPAHCREAILEFLPKAHLVKVSDEELAFITGRSNVKEGIASLFVGDVQAVLFSKGPNGAELITKAGTYRHPGFTVVVEDTTGAGDAFVGGFLYQLQKKNITRDSLLPAISRYHEELLRTANGCGALTAMGKGAIDSLPGLDRLEQFIGKERCHEFEGFI